MLRLIHISDLHLENETPSLNQENIINSLIKDLENYIEEKTILIFSGDLIDKSGVKFADQEFRFAFFEEILINKLIKKFPSLKGRILFIPGNHDLDRKEIDQFTDRPLRDNFNTTPDLVNKYIEVNSVSEKVITGLKDYKIFEKTFAKMYFEDDAHQVTNFESSYILNDDLYSVGVSCLNSAWLCFDNDNQGKIFVGKQQLENSLKFLKSCEIKIAVIHHPLSFLNSMDEKQIKALLYKNYDLVMFGHTHKGESSSIDDLDGNLFMSVGKSINGLENELKDYTCGYSILDFYKEEKIKVYYRKYLQQHNKFVIDTDVGNDSGIKIFNIPQQGELMVLHKTRSIIDVIIDERIPKLNDDLILNISQSNKTSLKEIFVEPIIGNLPETNLDQDEIQFFTSRDLVNSSENLMIFGSKEIGKTILLDKILVDLTNNYSRSKRLPVKISFNDIGNKNFKQLIRDFFLKSSHELSEILSSVPIDLLIDDIEFSNDFEYQIKELKHFINEYPKTRIIVTSLIADDKIPIEDIQAFSHLVPEFTKVYLHLFKSKQIKGLVSNWISNSDLDLHQNIEKLIKGFRELGLPKTPLAVTMFLWIINKQQNRPINNAVLVEMFVEKLLEKSKINNIYFDTFDFGDKQRLLAFISKFMLDKNNKTLNYRVKEYELSKEIERYLKDKIDIKPRTVLDYFIDRGILINCNENNLQFKTAFFFNYFLAKYMSFDNKFKLEVISNKNYLSFIDELDFYTGLNREDVEVFSFVHKELNRNFDDINNKVRNESEIIDKILESEDTISSRIDIANIKQKPSEKEIEEIYDSQISATPAKREIDPKKEIVPIDDKNNKSDKIIKSKDFSKILKLSSIVFKNSADIDPELRKSAYQDIILSSISFMMMYRDSILLYHKENKEEISKVIPKTMNFGFFMKVLPILHQTTMYNWLGSLKSAPIIRDKIVKDNQNSNLSELEKFLSVYIYADIRGKEHPIYVEEFMKNTKRKFILDSSFIKNMSYYYLRSKTAETDNRYLKLLADLKIKLGQTTKQSKSVFIQRMRDSKRRKEKE